MRATSLLTSSAETYTPKTYLRLRRMLTGTSRNKEHMAPA